MDHPIVIVSFAVALIWCCVRFGRNVARLCFYRPSFDLNKRESEVRLDPECQFIVTLENGQVACKRPEGTSEAIAIEEIARVELITTSGGPWGDVFWVLLGDGTECIIPSGAIGEGDLLKELQNLPGFDNAAVIKGMGSPADSPVVLWERPTATSALEATPLTRRASASRSANEHV